MGFLNTARSVAAAVFCPKKLEMSEGFYKMLDNGQEDEIMDSLKKNPSLFLYIDVNGNSPFHIVGGKGHDMCFTTMLRFYKQVKHQFLGLDPISSSNNYGDNCVHRYLSGISGLIHRSNVSSETENSPIRFSHASGDSVIVDIQHRESEIVEDLLRYNCSLLHQYNGIGANCFMMAVATQNFRAVEIMVPLTNYRDWSNENGQTVFHLTCSHTSTDVLELLLDHLPSSDSSLLEKADVNGDTPCNLAVRHDNISIFSVILRNVSTASLKKANNDGFCVAHLAATNANTAFIEQIWLKSPQAVMKLTYDKKNVFHCAAQAKNIPVIEWIKAANIFSGDELDGSFNRAADLYADKDVKASMGMLFPVSKFEPSKHASEGNKLVEMGLAMASLDIAVNLQYVPSSPSYFLLYESFRTLSISAGIASVVGYLYLGKGWEVAGRGMLWGHRLVQGLALAGTFGVIVITRSVDKNESKNAGDSVTPAYQSWPLLILFLVMNVFMTSWRWKATFRDYMNCLKRTVTGFLLGFGVPQVLDVAVVAYYVYECNSYVVKEGYVIKGKW